MHFVFVFKFTSPISRVQNLVNQFIAFITIILPSRVLRFSITGVSSG